MKMKQRLRTYGDLDLLDPTTTVATEVRRAQMNSPRARRPMNAAPGMPFPDRQACEGVAQVCPLGELDWRLCPHAGPSVARGEEAWPKAK